MFRIISNKIKYQWAFWAFVLFLSGIFSFAQEIILDNQDAVFYQGQAGGSGVVILMYHGLDAAYGQDPLEFEAQMQYLKDQNYQTLTLDALQSWIETGYPALPEKPVILTFDDNYSTIYTVAFPSLQAHDFVGYNFTHTNYVGVMTSYDHADWIEIIEMENAGVIFTESHTKSHPYLTSLTDSQIQEELAGSKSAIDSNIPQKNCIHLAYPYGNYDNNVIQKALDAGYETAVTTISGINTRFTPLMELRRYGVNPNTSMNDFTNIVSQSSGVEVTTWPSSTSEPGYYGSNYQYQQAGDGSSYAEWTFGVEANGDYELWVWYTDHSNRATNAPYTIHHLTGTTTIRIDQTQNGSEWVSLGVFPFLTGPYYTVRLANDANGYVIADALRIAPIDNEIACWQLY